VALVAVIVGGLASEVLMLLTGTHQRLVLIIILFTGVGACAVRSYRIVELHFKTLVGDYARDTLCIDANSPSGLFGNLRE
jgi:hypothetical protein